MRFSDSFNIFLLSVLIQSFAIGQVNDPKATLLMDNARIQLEEFESYFFNFKLITHHENENRTQEGSYKVLQNKYFIDMDEMQIFCDGSANYVIRNNKQDIEIYDIEEPSQEIDLLKGPSSILSFYKHGAFTYQLVSSPSEEDQVILFKPNERNTEIVKIALVLSLKNEIKTCQIFMRDASNILLEVSDFNSNSNMDKSLFKFNPSEYPNATIEDLRLD